jgi:DNA-binding transcriptional regulator YhcF (GntR family)
MRILINKNSDVPIRSQISEQVAMSIATARLKPGAVLPSVRELANRLDISRNTVSAAYQDLVDRMYIERRRGAKMVVRPLDALPLAPREDLDDLIDAAIRTARQHGYTLQELTQRVRERLLIEPPDHVLVVEPEPGMRRLLLQEISAALPRSVSAISPEELTENRGVIIGALVVCLPGRAPQLVSLVPKGHPFLVLQPSGIDAYVQLIHELKCSSVIGVASVSEVLLEMARPLLAPFVGSFHALEEHHLGEKEARDLSGLDLVICDSTVHKRIKARKIVEYRVVSAATTGEISNRMGLALD